MKRLQDILKLGVGLIFLSTCLQIHGDVVEELRNQFRKELEGFRQQAQVEMDAFRQKANLEYAQQLKNPWIAFPQEARIELPKIPEPPLPPIKDDDDEVAPIDRELPIDTVVVAPVPKPQPSPVYPIKEVPKQSFPDVNFSFYGNSIKVRGANFGNIKVDSSDTETISKGWEALSVVENDNLILDCIKLRNKLNLPDWGFFKLVDEVVSHYAPSRSNAHTLLMTYVLTQCGYAVKMCKASDDKLHLLFNYDGLMFNRGYLTIDGKWFYSYDQLPEGSLFLLPVAFKDEKAFSMDITSTPNFKFEAGNKRVLTVHGHPDIQLTCTPNKNLIDFFADYPSAALDKNVYTKWAVQGNTPMSEEIKSTIYPALRKAVKGLNQFQAVNLILKVAQSFDYGYDDEIWGCDRTFWAEESWHYPLSDCEDHAVNLTRMARDILGLDAVLIYYPGHLSAGIAITDGSQAGDYVVHNGKKYTVCDGTYFYAMAGNTAPSNDNSTAILIPLRK